MLRYAINNTVRMCDERVCDGRLYKDERMYDERKGM